MFKIPRIRVGLAGRSIFYQITGLSEIN